ncbi:hypothetical protein BDZ89DRAFT_1116310 [Hymenopellis radicata]|nr:hypothetical protein BDZ89DRAFT_1116310 [Hymenopellis radicata]
MLESNAITARATNRARSNTFNSNEKTSFASDWGISERSQLTVLLDKTPPSSPNNRRRIVFDGESESLHILSDYADFLHALAQLVNGVIVCYMNAAAAAAAAPCQPLTARMGVIRQPLFRLFPEAKYGRDRKANGVCSSLVVFSGEGETRDYRESGGTV